MNNKEYTIGKVMDDTVEVIEWENGERVGIVVVGWEEGDTAGDAIAKVKGGFNGWQRDGRVD